MLFGLQQNFNIIKYLLCKQTKYVSNYYKHIHTEYAIDTHLNCMWRLKRHILQFVSPFII